MAGPIADSFDNQQLWQTISGTGCLRPEAFVQHELNKNKAKLSEGLLFYKHQSHTDKWLPSGEVLNKRDLKQDRRDFIIRLAQFLGLNELQTDDLFRSYLFAEYKGSQIELGHILSHERSSQSLMLKIQEFYHRERLYLLRCLRHILHSLQDGDHAYKDIFMDFLDELLSKNFLGEKLLSQFENVCNTELPTRDMNGPLMGRAQILTWSNQNLREQAELLELLLVYYNNVEMKLPTLLDLCIRFKKHRYGWNQSYKHLVDGAMEKLVQRIGHLETLVLLEGFDLMNCVELSRNNNLSRHIFLNDANGMKELLSLISPLGSEAVHGPLLLGLSVLQNLQSEANTESDDGVLGKAAQQLAMKAYILDVFQYLLDLLNAEPFCGQTDLASVAHYLVYSIVTAVLSVYHEDTLRSFKALDDIAVKLFKWESIADRNWMKMNGEPEGLAILYESSKQCVPFDFVSFMQLNISLASTSSNNARQVKKELMEMTTFTEPLVHFQDLDKTSDRGVFILRKDKKPYQHSSFVIPPHTRGVVINGSATPREVGGNNFMIRWECRYNGWQMLMAEVQELLGQAAQGAGMVYTEQLLKASLVMKLVKQVLTSDPESVPEFRDIIVLAYQIIARFSVLTPCPLELVSDAIECLACSVPHLHSEVSHHLRQTGFLPFLVQNIDDFSQVLSGEGISQGLYGTIVAGTECTQGVYTVTISTLNLLTQLVEASSKKQDQNDENLAAILFLLRDIFPRYYKWRYVDLSQRKSIGQKCMQLFHKIFNFVNLPQKEKAGSPRGPNLQECCVFSLLFTEAGRALLEIVATGVDNIQQALSQQTSLLEGAGSDLEELIEMSLSVLNRLLLLKPPSLAGQPSPVELAFASAQHIPSTGNTLHGISGGPGQQINNQKHLVATVAQYIYHRHSHRLPSLATLLLKRLATVSPMSILACLGKNAESIRDMFLTRLEAASEDIQLKVGILELLSVCVESQPGLIEIFLNVQTKQGAATVTGTSDGNKPKLKPGRGSCLPILLDLMEKGRQGSPRCPPELYSACLELVHALWAGLRETPMAVLRESETFWMSLLEPLRYTVIEDDPTSLQRDKLKTKICAFSLRTIALEMFAVSSTSLDARLKKALKETFTVERLKYWSNALREQLEVIGLSGEPDEPVLSHEQSLFDHPALNLLLAWKNFLITTSRFKVAEVQITTNLTGILHNLLEGIKVQFKVGDLSELNVKLACISSALYFTLLKIWGRELCEGTTSTPAATLRNLTQAITESMSGDTVLPSVLVGLLGSCSLILQNCGQRLDNISDLLRDLLPVLCSAFLRSSWTLPSLLDSMDQNKDGVADQGSSIFAPQFGLQVKLQITCCCLMVEILHNSQDLNLALHVLQEQGILSCVLATTEAFFKSRQGISYVYSSLLLLTKIAETEKGANMLVNSNLTSHLCLVLTACYSREDSFQPRNILAKAFSTNRPSTISWHSLYCLSVNLFATCLATLGHAFLEDALNMVGVHQDRMQQSLEVARVSLTPPAVREAEATCSFLIQMCRFHRQWNFQLPHVLGKMMTSLVAMVHTYVALLIRPRYLLHLLDHSKSGGDNQNESKLLLTVPAHLQHQTSLDDVDQPTNTLVDAQHNILKLLTKSLLCLKHFTPVLPEILLDQGVDVSEWEPVLLLGFGTPSLDENVTGISFGTLLNCVTACIRMLTKNDSKSVSPHRASPDPKLAQVPKSVIQLTLELSLQVLLSQACRYLRDPSLTQRDRQFLKRELGTELNSCLSPLHRQMRRSGGGDRTLSSPSSGSSNVQTSVPGTPGAISQTPTIRSATGKTLTPQMSRSTSQTFAATQDPAFFKFVHLFVNKVLK